MSFAAVYNCDVRIKPAHIGHGLQANLTSPWEGRTDPYIGSLLVDCSFASKEPVYKLFRPSHKSMALSILKPPLIYLCHDLLDNEVADNGYFIRHAISSLGFYF